MLENKQSKGRTYRKLLRKAPAKAQSAMEYLMTYGWAILIIAVVLGALFELGIFNTTSFTGSSCIAESGFYCNNPILSTGGVLTVTIGQATGTTLQNAYVYFVPSGTAFSTSDPSTSIGTFNLGGHVTISIPLRVGSPYPAAYTLGTPLSGYLYLLSTNSEGAPVFNNIATVQTKVTATSSVVLSQSPSSVPSGIVAYAPLTVSNSQSSATPAPFQEMLQINLSNYASYITYNGVIANFEFFYSNGTVIPAWIESNISDTLRVWLKFSKSIPASSSIITYLGFAGKTINLLSSSGTSGIGEASQLTCQVPTNTITCSNYGAYDDGADVFPVYTNFAGTTTPSGWTIVSGTAGTDYSIDNGFQLKTTATRVEGPSVTQNFILEGYFQFAYNSYAGWDFGIYHNSSVDYGLHADTAETSGGPWTGTYYMDNGYHGMVAAGGGTGIGDYYIWQIINNGGDVTISFDNPSYQVIYAAAIPLTASFTNPLTNNAITFGERFDGFAAGSPLNVTFYWIRVRSLPPSGVELGLGSVSPT